MTLLSKLSCSFGLQRSNKLFSRVLHPKTRSKNGFWPQSVLFDFKSIEHQNIPMVSSFGLNFSTSKGLIQKASGNASVGITSDDLGLVFEFDMNNMPVNHILKPAILEKLMEYSTISPTPISITEFMSRGTPGAVSEEESYNHLKTEVAVRLAHMIMELQHLPRELHAEERCRHTLNLYSKSFSQIIEFESKPPCEKTLREFMEILKTFKARHSNTVPDMAKACMSMKKRLKIPKEDVSSHIFSSIKIFLDRLYTSRISIHMITNQHLAVYGYERTPPNQFGAIDPNTNVASILVDAYDEALLHIESCYMIAPKLVVKTHDASTHLSNSEPGTGTLIPSHLYLIFYEVFKNAMRATVEHYWDKKDKLPPIKVIICQADDDFSIKISDQGGGIDRETVEKLFFYLYSTESKYSTEDDQRLGYGLPLARLYARYFHGDLKVASYEGFGTDIYIYINALASSAIERLPVYNKESVEYWVEEQAQDWTSYFGTEMMTPSIDRLRIPEADRSCIVKPKED